MDPNFNLLDSSDLGTFDPNFKPLNTCDLETQGLMASLGAAEAEAEAEALRSDGKKQERKRRLIEVDDDEVDSDVEITAPPTQSSLSRKQFSFGSGSATSSKATQSKKKPSVALKKPSVAVIRGGRRSSKPTQSKKKPTVVVRSREEIDMGAESDELNLDDEEKQRRQTSDVWVDFVVIRKPNGEEKAKCNHCKNEYAWSSHSHGTSALRRHRFRCKMYARMNVQKDKMGLDREGKVQPRKYDHLVFRQLVAKTIVQHDLPYSYVEYEKVRDTWKYLNIDVETICRNTAKADVFRLYESERDALKRELASLPGRVSLTSDLYCRQRG